MDIKKVKKKYKLNNRTISGWFGLTEAGYNNSSAKDRYDNAIVKVVEHIESHKAKKDE